ncbi:MAG: hypothetical protein ABWX84_07505 [Nocardioides sp.]
MSKMEGLRAMREARYEQAKKRSGTPAAKAPVAPKAPARPATSSAAPSEPAAPTEALCGHRNMSGRTCTREHGHAAKSHRYS